MSLFVNAEEEAVRLAARLKVDAIEIHTGHYAEAMSASGGETEGADRLERIRKAASLGKSLGLWVAAGHGLHYTNVAAVAAIPEIVEFNVGHSIVARAVMVGLEAAVRELHEVDDRFRHDREG